MMSLLLTISRLASGRGGRTQVKRDSEKTLPVLLYHRVGPVQPGARSELTVAPAKFERQMRWLKRQDYQTIRSGDCLAWLRERKRLPARAVLLTFDDAYADLGDYAFPVLKRYAFTATVFVVTGEIGGYNSWEMPEASSELPCMDAEKIRHWAAQGIEFGAHTRSHADLTTLSEAEMEDEVGGSGRDLAAILGVSPTSFAYPYGKYNESVRQAVDKAYRLAITCDEGLNGPGTDPLLLLRTMVQPGDTLLDFAMRLQNGYSSFERLRMRLRPRSRLRGLLGKSRGS